ncbi:hypothetical protein D3C75_1294080 [compost metagenome]
MNGIEVSYEKPTLIVYTGDRRKGAFRQAGVLREGGSKVITRQISKDTASDDIQGIGIDNGIDKDGNYYREVIVFD